MSDNLKGKVAIVTGSGQGIGRAIALALAREGAAIVTNNRKKGSTGLNVVTSNSFPVKMTEEEKELAAKLSGDAETVANEIIRAGGRAIPFYGDVGDFEVAGSLVQTAVDKFGKIDIVVNNAGTFGQAYSWEMTEQEWDHVNCNKPKSSFNTLRHALPFMIKQKWGRLINCTSTAWLGGQYHHSHYSAANAGVVGLTRAVAREVFQYGITCNAYAPGALTRSVINLISLTNNQLNMKGKALTIAPRATRVPSPENLAPFIAYLASDAAANISGTVFGIHGGHIGRYSDPQEVASLEKNNGLWTVDELIERVPEALLKGYNPRTS